MVLSLATASGFAEWGETPEAVGFEGFSPADVYISDSNEGEQAEPEGSGESEFELGEGPGEEPEWPEEPELPEEPQEPEEEELEIETPESVFSLIFHIDGDLYITLEEYEEAFELALALAIAQALAEGLEEDDVDRNAV
ncbi:MAG: hypothetical protein FWE19_08300, partial [Oscillospiraceae bacterium]|nr:hypothetical protein [Oscillospiraceae bacterium]